jgi:hypothetical protein
MAISTKKFELGWNDQVVGPDPAGVGGGCSSNVLSVTRSAAPYG